MEFSKNSLFKVIHISDKDNVECSTPEYDIDFFTDAFDIIRLENDNDIKRILSENPCVDAIVTQSSKGWKQYENLSYLPKWLANRWFHYDDYENHGSSIYRTTMTKQVSQPSGYYPMFSIFTPLYNTRKEFFLLAYESLCKQSLNDWEWILVDDSPEELTWVKEYFKENPDPRVKYFRIAPTNGNIGLSKWRACCMSTGKWLLEFDHDDLLHPIALEVTLNAINKFPNAGFIYSDNEDMDENGKHLNKIYGDEFAYGFGHPYKISDTIWINDSPNLNSATVRHIVGIPNHIRCWERQLYFMIGGHNQTMRIADDYELCIKTFLTTRMVRIKFPLYAQRYYDGNSQDTDVNRSDIQRRVDTIANIYNEEIHKRLIELLGEDYGYEKGLTASQIASRCAQAEDKSIIPYANYIYEIL